MRAGTGGSLVHTEERLQVEEQNDGRHDDVQRRKNGNWEVGWVFLQVNSVRTCSPSHSSALPFLSVLAFSGRYCRNKITNSSLSSDLI